MGVEKHDRGNSPLLKITNQRHTRIESELTKKKETSYDENRKKKLEMARAFYIPNS